MRMKVVIGMAAFALGAAAPLAAHHAFAAEFDVNQPVKVKGTITKVEWVNPHAWLYVDVKGDDGKVINWRFELGAPNANPAEGTPVALRWLQGVPGLSQITSPETSAALPLIRLLAAPAHDACVVRWRGVAC